MRKDLIQPTLYSYEVTPFLKRFRRDFDIEIPDYILSLRDEIEQTRITYETFHQLRKWVILEILTSPSPTLAGPECTRVKYEIVLPVYKSDYSD